MQKNVDSEILDILKEMEKKTEFLEEEVVAIKSWLSDDAKLSPYEKKMVEGTVQKVRSGKADRNVANRILNRIEELAKDPKALCKLP